MDNLMDFLRILGIVVLIFGVIFSFICAFMFMVAGPTILHTVLGTPVALTLLSGSIFGIKKILDGWPD